MHSYSERKSEVAKTPTQDERGCGLRYLLAQQTLSLALCYRAALIQQRCVFLLCARLLETRQAQSCLYGNSWDKAKT